jgi:hypothetical protein
VDFLRDLRRTDPSVAQAAVRKDEELLHRLKEVFVTSQDPFDPDELKQPANPERPLPQKQNPALRAHFQDQHIFDATDIKPKEGKISLTTAQDILAKAQGNPKANTPSVLAAAHGLKAAQVEDLLRHFAVFSLHQTDVTAATEDPLQPQASWEVAALPASKGLLPPPPTTSSTN